ncbi:hypothetical protein BCV69DRAFT_311590 [Microstroma glucosiphilum]|uniref:FUN14-domain-containing protein n=1 Tax=Pseudomicrostroma glucosiphilum TaxID=1684307 RepID=A0A316UBW1_9BASI|nr:hypothetical protein BCV69DRAFT_311590 [Pseudomicrostroma glucosiphilum]PWN21883.1 hypothetical protein BCV69DRAFT_311590 [Pseudomicrostroma glucosiphilum]
MALAAPLRVGLAPCFRLRSGFSVPRQVLRNASTSSQRGFQAHSRTAVLNAGPRPGSANAGSKGFNWSLLAGAAFATTASAAMVSRNTIHCVTLTLSSVLSTVLLVPSIDATSSSALDRSSYTGLSGSNEPAPESIVNVYQLSFGVVCGVCAGVFIKKGLKFIAFLLGGGFILLQYLNSQKLVSVNWGGISKRYDGLVGSVAGPGEKVKGWQGSTAGRIYTRFEDFLTANFQERASLLAGLALGLRLG